MQGYFVMPRYGTDLENFFNKGGKLSKASIYYLGLVLLQLLEQIHTSGYIYNDLKADNIMVSYGDKIKACADGENAFSQCTINLVDYGFASKYLVRDPSNGRKIH